MSHHTAVLALFEKYQKARFEFIQGVAELAEKDTFSALMLNAGVLHLINPLMKDFVPNIQQTASLALGRLAKLSPSFCKELLDANLLPSIVENLSSKDPYSRKASAFILRSIAQHGPEFCRSLIASGCVDGLCALLKDLDPSVKEAGAWTLGYLVQHTSNNALTIVESGAIESLIECTMELEVPLKRIAISVLGDIAKHTPDLAQKIVNKDALKYAIPLLENPDSGLRRQVCILLAQIAKHSDALAHLITTKALDKVVVCLKGDNRMVRRNAAICIREICKHSLKLCDIVASKKGLEGLVAYLQDFQGVDQLPVVMAIGYISAFSETHALTFLDLHISPLLQRTLLEQPEDYMKVAASWTFGQLGKHSPDHAFLLYQDHVLEAIIHFLSFDGLSKELLSKTRKAIKLILKQCISLEILQSVLTSSPQKVQKYTLRQLLEVLPTDSNLKKEFVSSGALTFLQELKTTASEKGLPELIDQVLVLFPQEIVSFYAPNYASKLVDLIK